MMVSSPAFAAKDMKTLRLPASLKAIRAEAFAGSPAEAVIIPEKCDVIDPEAFVNCRNLIYVRVPAGVTIPDGAFMDSPGVMIDRK